MKQLELYREMVQSALFSDGPIVVFIWENSDGWPVVDVSSNIKRLYGYDVKAYQNKSLVYSDQIHPDDLGQVFTEVIQASSGNDTSFTHEPYRYLSSDGNYHWVSDSTTIVRNDKDEITHYVGYLTDISDYVNTQKELLQKTKWYKELFDISPVGIALNRMSGEFMDLNCALHDMCGYTRDEFVKLSYWDITPIEYEEQEGVQLESLQSRGMYGPYQKEYIHKDGHRIPVLLNGVKNIDENGDEYIWSVVQDISELSHAHSQMKTNELKFLNVFEQANDGMLIIENGLFSACNKKAMEILRCDEAYIVGKTLDSISPKYQPDGQISLDKAIGLVNETLKGEAQLFEWQHIDPKGDFIEMEVSLGLFGSGDSGTLLCL
jgi:PAS domain S-box-containing protein